MVKACNFKFLAALVLLTLVVREHRVGAEVKCDNVVSKMLSCTSFLLGGATTPSTGCCSSVQALDTIAMASRDDKRAICQCLKAAAKSLPINFDKAAQLPTLCHVDLDVVISPNVDCDKV